MTSPKNTTKGSQKEETIGKNQHNNKNPSSSRKPDSKNGQSSKESSKPQRAIENINEDCFQKPPLHQYLDKLSKLQVIQKEKLAKMEELAKKQK